MSDLPSETFIKTEDGTMYSLDEWNRLHAPVPRVYAAISAVTAELAAMGGISKDQKAAVGKSGASFNFRGIDDLYNAMAPLLAKHKLCILPRIVGRSSAERHTSGGTVLFSVVVNAEFTFVSAEDGSTAIVATVGEAMDSGDKATNKAMSAAMKYALLMAFQIPTQGDNDADATTHSNIRSFPSRPPPPSHPPAAERDDAGVPERVKNGLLPTPLIELQGHLDKCISVADVEKIDSSWTEAVKAGRIKTLTSDHLKEARRLISKASLRCMPPEEDLPEMAEDDQFPPGEHMPIR